MKIKVNLNPSYEIEIERGLVSSLPKGFVITDRNVANKYKNLLGKNKFVIDPGEKSKSPENYIRILEKLEKLPDVERIIAFGGGVVGDLAGFVASTYRRGVELTHVPTTLLAMVDSSIGGKNGINFGRRKNYIGTIYQPKRILIDPSFLETLPEKEFRNASAEIIKYAYLFGTPRLERLHSKIRAEDSDLERIISQCCKNKAGVIEKDEKDENGRHALNFGHTFGHAIELLYNLDHGEAISIGMVKELELGSQIGLAKKEDIEKIKEVLEANGLPTEFPPNFDPERVLEAMRYDKKGEFVFAFDIVDYNVKLDKSTVREFLRSA